MELDSFSLVCLLQVVWTVWWLTMMWPTTTCPVCSLLRSTRSVSTLSGEVRRAEWSAPLFLQVGANNGTSSGFDDRLWRDPLLSLALVVFLLYFVVTPENWECSNVEGSEIVYYIIYHSNYLLCAKNLLLHPRQWTLSSEVFVFTVICDCSLSDTMFSPLPEQLGSKRFGKQGHTHTPTHTHAQTNIRHNHNLMVQLTIQEVQSLLLQD